MLQIRDLEEIRNDPKKVEELLYDDEKKLLHQYEERMKRACAEGSSSIRVTEMPEALHNLLKLNGYEVVYAGDGEYIIWFCQETENDEEDIEIYAIVTTDDEMHSSIKAYYSTEELAKKHKSDYAGFYNTSPEIRKVILHRK